MTLLTLHQLLRRAGGDSRIHGVAFSIGQSGIDAGTTEELTRMVASLRTAGKKIRVYGHSFNLVTWIFASLGDEISLHPAGKIDLRGVKQAAERAALENE